MPLPRRYAEWRSVATARLPARWIGLAAGCVLFAVGSVALRHPKQIVYMGAVALAAFVSNRVAARRLEALRDEGEDHQFGATLRLMRGTAYGHDEGLLLFEDGYLVYMGRRCAFSLGGRDVKLTKLAENECEFVFRGPEGRHIAHLQWTKNEWAFEAITAWQKARRRSGESVLPPVTPGPSYTRAVVVLVNALPGIALLVAAASSRSNGRFDRWIDGVAIPILSVWIVGSAFSQAQELKRLSVGEPTRRNIAAHLRRLRRLRSLSGKGRSDHGEASGGKEPLPQPLSETSHSERGALRE